ncbi:DUF2378 family protein [Archangium violaceum]|uniref:TIGR02265 family protein n=1 Tax=Archangium violaceum TaxID=83451 RepID=UPI00194F033D|nr:DUF2378 family protein [Archangium violaceum]QRO01144.1 DUF2378 family protein [Archangium violaceum]
MLQDSEAAVVGRSAEFWARDFARRISMVRPEDTLRGMFCNGLLRFARGLGCEKQLRRCLAAGGEEKFVDFFSYPIVTYLRMVSTVLLPLAERYGTVEEALRALGKQAMVDLQGSAAGKALAMMNTGDMRSRLDAVFTAYRVSVSFGEHTLAWRGPTSARITLKRVLMPCPFHEGLMLAVLGSEHLRPVKVIGRQTGLLDCEFDIFWE